MNCLKFDIPLMALTATATVPVRQDIIQSLLMSEGTKIVLTSFFRPNLRFSVSLPHTAEYYNVNIYFFKKVVCFFIDIRTKMRKNTIKEKGWVDFIEGISSCYVIWKTDFLRSSLSFLL